MSLPQKPSDIGSARRWTATVLLLILAVVVVPVVAAHLPPRLKLIFLFPVILGGIAGWLLSRGYDLGSLRRGTRFILTLILLSVTMAIFVGASFWQWRRHEAALFRLHVLSQPGGRALLDEAMNTDSETTGAQQNMLDVYRRRLNPSFDDYFNQRKTIVIPVRSEPLSLSRVGVGIVLAIEAILAIVAGLGVVYWQSTTGEGIAASSASGEPS